MLLHEKVQRAGALGPYGLVAVHVGEIHERVFLRTSPPGLAVSAVENYVHARGNLLILSEHMGELQVLARFQGHLAQHHVTT